MSRDSVTLLRCVDTWRVGRCSEESVTQVCNFWHFSNFYINYQVNIALSEGKTGKDFSNM